MTTVNKEPQIKDNNNNNNNNNENNNNNVTEKKPTNLIILGMAGSGKTTLLQRLRAHIYENKIPGYIINLDPAVANLPYTPNIDIRDTVNYKEVMKQYNLGPNGGIVTSLNLFSTKFDKVLEILERRANQLKYVILDTPGQIEVFTWSASGSIITELMASSGPTVLVYVIDTPRTIEPTTFMSNMLYACSIMYKSRLPMVIAFNKVDVTDHQFAEEWMTDFDSFQDALTADPTYMGSLTRSLSLVLEEFYSQLQSVGVSAVDGTGIDTFFEKVDLAVGDYYKYYKTDLEKMKSEQLRKQEEQQVKQFEKLKKDLEDSKGAKVVYDFKSDPNKDSTGSNKKNQVYRTLNDFDENSDDENDDDEDDYQDYENDEERELDQKEYNDLMNYMKNNKLSDK
ncbi:AAA ATPase domain-containing protein [Tieghemostelium lacteum]|uniref:GPN-loop GTPase n=1 Tax=Tieghemostelium lacteum TaxID=361077 RepID=A0A152A107_TIELA|nr:AAA ATPase domain-containing protein [Tieghemostelium lacteum]|eukprot:KYQ99878.1 AAA ATPase domain-containing protein [Tieghemostelium lacteum]